MTYDTIEQAARAWVETFNQIPMGIVEKIMKAADWETDALYEVTPPAVGNRVTVMTGDAGYEEGEIVGRGSEPDTFLVKLDETGEEVTAESDDFVVDRDTYLPMWGTMWAFSDNIDNYWLSGQFGENGLQLMADCGFRIYEQEDYGYIFGIDGAGYDFFKEHWIPLYKARGLHWHAEEEVAG